MKYTQNYGRFLKSTLEIDLHETGFDYLFTDKLLFGQPRMDKAFITYTNITNQRIFAKRNHPDSKKIIFTLVAIFLACFVVVVSTSANAVYASPYEGYYTAGFYAGLIAVFVVYKFFAVQKVIKMSESNGGSFLVLNNEGGEKIIEEILKNRNNYLREKFISNNNYKTLSLESVEYLTSIGVIGREEATEIKEKIRPNSAGVVGFDKKE